MVVPLIGYLDRFSARPGERLEVKVSSQLGIPYQADLVRVRHADPNPAGPGMRLVPVPAPWAGEYPSVAKPVPSGSLGRAAGRLALGECFTLLVRVAPWLPREAPQVVLAITGEGRAVTLSVTSAGFAVEARHGAAAARCATAAPPQPRRWYELAVTVGEGRLTLSQRPLQRVWGATDDGAAEAALPMADWSGESAVTFAAAPDATAHFNGRIEDPLLLRGTPGVTLEDPEALLASGRVAAWWDFSQAMEGEAILERGPAALHGSLTNLPARAVKGSRWTGAEHVWRHALRHYAAIHFHEDDLEDCRWATDFAVPIPKDMPSGVYAVRLRAGDHWDMIPFFVLPPKGVARAPIAYLANTFTCQVYANYRRPEFPEDHRRKRQSWGAFDWCGNLVTAYGLSTYNNHRDGSGIHLSSRLRPIMNMRPGFVAVPDPAGSGLRHLPADSHLTDWLEEKGFAFDVITDEDLDNEGPELLSRYKCVVTGSHPEYHTQDTLDALQAFVSGGGRLAYLGGNGFYWKVARRRDRPHMLEIRRAEGGIRAWAAETGEYYHQLDGTLGGLWRRNGRPPQVLCGVGFSGQGKFEGSHYRAMPGAADPRAAWILEGTGIVPGETFGGFGLSGGGAAGFELDRADPMLGTPPNAVILARSEGHQDHFVTVPEELLTHITTVTGENPEALIRAEIVYFETRNGGAVFSTGSITFCGSLSHDGYANPISRMLENVLTRFQA
ncbi:N,N-dimethylformamidase beta subunit family domain-containing protein [Roseicella aerolata]|uniref:N,N-dimethylformamidase large subunit n=1 Tax=Roseicella aerolata TaxID=2883479 RepID=A0A9X1ICY8_9PROT|nr:N,N-dimethylformamidase beta subunit family domain-containing protein [Roseicella aerolata]MCB4821684.1 N,N-dimethylformamidase large subunit [Roseicella aerolata]